jgi:hypothetical protein
MCAVGLVGASCTASYGLLLPAANFHRIWFGVESDMLPHLLGGKKLKESINTLNGKILFVHGRISCLTPKEMATACSASGGDSASYYFAVKMLKWKTLRYREGFSELD